MQSYAGLVCGCLGGIVSKSTRFSYMTHDHNLPLDPGEEGLVLMDVPNCTASFDQITRRLKGCVVLSRESRGQNPKTSSFHRGHSSRDQQSFDVLRVPIMVLISSKSAPCSSAI